jgi:hypothetical protein
VFENRCCGPKRDEATGGWRKLHIENLHNFYSSPNIIRMIKSGRKKWVGHVAHMGKMRNAYKTLVGKREGKKSLRRPRHRWKDNIKMDLKETECDDVDRIHLVQDRD